MNKTERLILLLKHLTTDTGISLKEISERYNVSERTVYRDINTLSNLGFDIRQKGGFLADKDERLNPLKTLNETEIRLIIFALRTNSLGNVFPFKELAERLEKFYAASQD